MIPDGWNTQKLEEVSVGILDCHHSTPEWTDSGYIVLRTNNIRNGVLDFSSVSFTSELNYHERVKRAIPEEGDIVVTREAPAGEVALILPNLKVCLGQRLVLVKLKHNLVSAAYIKFYLMSDLVQRNVFQLQANGSTVGNIRIPVLKSINLLLPPLLEQCRIAEILGVWDESIDLLEKLIGRVRSRKQGLMQQLLTGKKRFKEFEGSEWKRYHFKDIFKRITRKNTVNNSNILTISGTYGLINQRDFFNKRVAADNLDGYYLIEKGEFAYNKSYSNGYPLGAIKRLDRYDAGVLSTLYICFGLSNSLNSGDFMAHYFESGIFNKEIYGIAQEGARNHGLLNIGVNDFFELFLRIPPLPEQEKIAAVLSAADEEISTLEKQLAAYKQQKLGLMQQLLTGRIRI
jgi:type I restriction enzyme, S subunit